MITEYEFRIRYGALTLIPKRKYCIIKDVNTIDDVANFLVGEYQLYGAAYIMNFVFAYKDNKVVGFMQTGIGDNKEPGQALNTAFKFLLLANAEDVVMARNGRLNENDRRLHEQIIQIAKVLNIGIKGNLVVQDYDKYYDLNNERRA